MITIFCVMYWGCSGAYMIWLVYFKKLCEMFYRVLKEKLQEERYIWCDAVSSEPKTRKYTQEGPFNTFNYDETWLFWVNFGQIQGKLENRKLPSLYWLICKIIQFGRERAVSYFRVFPVSLKIFTCVKVCWIVLKPFGKDMIRQAGIIWRMTIWIFLS